MRVNVAHIRDGDTPTALLSPSKGPFPPSSLLNGHCARDRRGPGEGTLRFDERIDFGSRFGREGSSAPRLEVGMGVHALKERGYVPAGLVRHKHKVVAKLRCSREHSQADS